MDSEEAPAIASQERFWNEWNAENREVVVGPISRRQAEQIIDWIVAIGRKDLAILDVGCGSGWMCEKLLPFGHVIGTDLAGEVLERARARVPGARFVAGDFMSVDLPLGQTDVVVTMEVLSHVADQRAFVSRVASLLKPGGLLMLATQNRFVLERSAAVVPRAPGQIRNWVDRTELRRLLQREFEIVELSSIYPNWGHEGVLRVVNSPRLNSLCARLVPQMWIDRLKERLFLGHTLMALARRRS